MATGLVIGIYPGSDPKTIEDALTAQQVDLTKVKVVSTTIDDAAADASLLHFIDVAFETDADSYSSEMTRGTGVLPDSGGTSVPGINSPSLREEQFISAGGHSAHYLDGYAVPDDEVDNFDDALEEGRTVVLYPEAGTDAPTVATAFKAAGLHNVRSY